MRSANSWQRVLVQCNGSSTLLPVTPVTTPAELIRAAAKGSSEHIDARSSVLVEYFAKVGVQRPIRRYERIVDIMNGWDDDAQNGKHCQITLSIGSARLTV